MGNARYVLGLAAILVVGAAGYLMWAVRVEGPARSTSPSPSSASRPPEPVPVPAFGSPSPPPPTPIQPVPNRAPGLVPTPSLPTAASGPSGWGSPTGWVPQAGGGLRGDAQRIDRESALLIEMRDKAMHSSPAERANAIGWLMSHGTAQDYPMVRDLSENAPDPEVRGAAVGARTVLKSRFPELFNER